MSYCRWSSDDFRCDLYVYGGGDGGVRIYVASQRHDIPEDAYPPPVADADVDAWVSRHMQVMKLIEGAKRVPIGLPYDGESWHLGYREAAVKVRELIAAGYRCDPSVADELEAEAEAARPSGARTADPPGGEGTT